MGSNNGLHALDDRITLSFRLVRAKVDQRSEDKDRLRDTDNMNRTSQIRDRSGYWKDHSV
jgi:hypothetical protein